MSITNSQATKPLPPQPPQPSSGVVRNDSGVRVGNLPPIEQRSQGEDFRESLGHGLANVRRNLLAVGVFSFVINMLVLAIPIYLFNLSDRVLTSRSLDTLVMLSIVVLGAIIANVLLDSVRRIILMRTAVELESKLGGPVLSAAPT